MKIKTQCVHTYLFIYLNAALIEIKTKVSHKSRKSYIIPIGHLTFTGNLSRIRDRIKFIVGSRNQSKHLSNM